MREDKQSRETGISGISGITSSTCDNCVIFPGDITGTLPYAPCFFDLRNQEGNEINVSLELLLVE